MNHSHLSHTQRNSIVVSIVLHLIALVLWSGLIDFDLFKNDDKLTKSRDEAPIVFELQQPRRPHEVVETPEDAKVNEFQNDTDLASDKNALARDSEVNSRLPLAGPFARGDVEFRELLNNPAPPGEQGVRADEESESRDEKKSSKSQPEETGDIYASQQFEKFSREYLTNQKKVKNPGAQENVPRARYDQQDTRALEKGGISFNTYEWNFAPYMLALKKRVERNIFPPPAFTRMGIISGETLLRFKIYPNGELRDLVLVSYDGHETLMQTSMRAIEISAPFMPLPTDFPESHLEVTAKFHYFIPSRN